MILLNPLDYVLGHASKIAILRFLCRTRMEMNGREISRAVKLSHVKCHAALSELVGQGVVSRRRSGQAILYRLSPRHFLYQRVLKPLFAREQAVGNELARMILQALSPHKPISLALFGSSITPEARTDSDIDLLAILPDRTAPKAVEPGFVRAGEAVGAYFGNQLSPLVVQQREFRRKIGARDPLYSGIYRKHKIIYGSELTEALA